MTRTTRKTTTGRLLTTLLAVLALIGATMAFTMASASADEGKVWICHADVNGGNGQPNLGEGGTGGEAQVGFNLIEVDMNAWENAHNKLHPNDFLAYSKNGQYSCTPFAPDVPQTYTANKTATATFCWNGAVKTETTTGSESFTTVDGAVPDTTKTATDATAQAKADAALATLLSTNYAARTEVPANGVCPTGTTFTGTATVQASTWICPAPTGTSISVAGPVLSYTVGPQATAVTAADIAAMQAAHQGDARAALVAQLGTQYPGYVETIAGADCASPPPPVTPENPTGGTPAVVAAPEAATVAAPQPATVVAAEPATVAVPQKGTVAVPQKGTVAPAAVPAGDGGSIPTVPAYVLALLALAGAALMVSGVRLATRRIG